jgi:hypothetical protein
MIIFAAFFISLILVFGGNASLHPEMGPPHILDPEGILMDEGGLPRPVMQGRYKTFSPSEDYKELQIFLNRIRTELGKNPNPQQRKFLEKMLFTTQEGLVHLYLKDRNIHARGNKKVGEYAFPGSKKKSTEPFNRVADKSGAILWAHRQGVLGQGVDVWVLEDYGTLQREGLAPSKLVSVIKSSQPPLQQGLRGHYDIRDESLAHGAEVAGVLYQIAPRADIHLIGDTNFSALFRPTHPSRGQADDPFPARDVILNWSGAKGSARVSVDYQIGHIRGFFEARSRYGDLLVKALPNREGGGPGQGRDRKKMIAYATGPYPLLSETDPAFAEHILKHYGAHIILAGSMGKHGPALRPFLVNDTLQELAQERFLIAWGDDALVPFMGNTGIEVKSGTSIAAPTISGAAALIKSKYSHLTCAEAGEILLESAEKTFWEGSGSLKLVYDPEDFEEESPEELGAAFAELFGEAFVPKSEKIRLSSKIKAEPFSSALYGRGILNLRRAFIYAEIKDKHRGFTAEQLKPLFKAAVREQEDKAARTIQRAFRANIDKFKSRGGEAGKA